MKSLETILNVPEEKIRELLPDLPFPKAACYLGEKLLERDPIKAFETLAYSVENGFIDAYLKICECYLEGIGHPQDIELAEICINQFNEESSLDIDHSEKYQEFIDLGLPSGTLWATCNIGATSPMHIGETYNYSSDLDCTDHAKLFNPEWRTPSVAQFSELVNKEYTTSKYIRKGLVWGWEITSLQNGNKVFFPLGIPWINRNGVQIKESIALWTSSFFNGNMRMAVFANATHLFGDDNYGHSHKLPIRPVKYKRSVTENELVMKRISDDEMESLLRESGHSEEDIAQAKKRYLSDEEMDKKVKEFITNMFNAHFVDLGLPSGTRWSRMNTNAHSIENYGNPTEYLNFVIPDWRILNLNIQLEIPSIVQMKELLEHTKHEYVNHKGCTYWKLTSIINDEFILLPVGVDFIENGKRLMKTDISHYWTSTEDENDGNFAFTLAVGDSSKLDLVSLNINTKAYLRPVVKKYGSIFI